MDPNPFEVLPREPRELAKAYSEWAKACSEWDKAYSEWDKARSEWDKARSEWAKELTAIHNTDWPDNTWNGKDIFTK